MPGRSPRVVSIDVQRSVETDADRLHNDLLDLIESLMGKKILSDTIQGVERPSSNSELSYAVIYHGDFKVIIPVLEVLEEPEDYRNQSKGDVLHYMLNKRPGAEIDYIVKGVDSESGIAVTSRLEAMAMKRKEYYFRTDRDGNYQIYEGIRAEARVVSVIRAGIFIDLFGAEWYAPLKEFSYQRWIDAAAHYQSGHRVLVRVLEVDRSDRNCPRITASVKQAGAFPVPVVVDEFGVLAMDLGGSTTYTLSCLNSGVPIPDPVPEPEQNLDAGQPSAEPSVPIQQLGAAPASNESIPIFPIVLFLPGLAFAVGGGIALFFAKRSQQLDYDDWEDEEDDL